MEAHLKANALCPPVGSIYRLWACAAQLCAPRYDLSLPVAMSHPTRAVTKTLSGSLEGAQRVPTAAQSVKTAAVRLGARLLRV